jgi:hypothetical protein
MISGLPEPRPDRLTLYFGGPGFGESTVLHTPSGHWIVMDVWEKDELNFPCEVLRQCNATTLDLLILSHTDSDHIAGVPALHHQFPVQQIWHYSQQTFSNFIADACDLFERRGLPPTRRFSDLRAANVVIAQLAESSRTTEATFTTSPAHFGEVTVIPLAPVSADVAVARLQVEKVLTFDESELEIKVVDRLTEYLEQWRDAKNPDRHDANRISIAATITWGATRILLGGDVHYKRNNPRTGWAAVLNYLRHCEQTGRDLARTTQLLRDLSVVKVAHHASKTSFWEELWALHTGRPDGSNVPVPWALVAPFCHGEATIQPPHVETLKSIRAHAHHLICSAAPEHEGCGWDRFDQAEWLAHPTPEQVVVGQGPWICLDMDDDGRVELRGVGDDARMFTARA